MNNVSLKVISKRKFFEIIKPQLIEAHMIRAIYDSGGICSSAESLDYFSRLQKLGDFASATRIASENNEVFYAYHYPYLDFGISRIYETYHYVIGMISKLK